MSAPQPAPLPEVPPLRLPEWFVPFSPRWSDPERATESYRRKLPHWRYGGATYFVTFRLHDSLPRAVAAALHRESAAWARRLAAERAASGGQLSSTTETAHADFQREHFRQLETHLDACHGACPLRHPANRAAVEHALLYFQNERCHTAACVVMPNHVHALVCPLPGWALESLAGSWKKHSADRLHQMHGTLGRLWQPETHDRLVRDGDHFYRAVRYILRNPAKARLCPGESSVWLSPEILRPAPAPPP